MFRSLLRASVVSALSVGALLLGASTGMAEEVAKPEPAAAEAAKQMLKRRFPNSKGARNIHPNKARRLNAAETLKERRKDAAERRAQRKAELAEAKKGEDKGKEKPKKKEEKKVEVAKIPEPAKPAPVKRKPIVYKDVLPTPIEERMQRALSLRVTGAGPYLPWTATVSNVGGEPVRIFKDVRLLWLELNVPGRKKPELCRLPSEMLPGVVRDGSRTLLEPGQSFSFEVDPRMFCFEASDTSLFVPGTFVRPHYGWETNSRMVWDKGKLRRLRLAQKGNYVVKPQAETPDGLKEIEGNGTALGTEYALWSKTRIDSGADKPRSLVLEVSRGADVSRGARASVEVKLTNHAAETARVHLRREFLSFEVRGPTGEFECASEAALRAPEALSMQALAPGKSLSMTVQLAEFCDAASFDAPGLYYVTAVLPLAADDASGEPARGAEVEPIGDEIGASGSAEDELPVAEDAEGEREQEVASTPEEAEDPPSTLRSLVPRLVRVRAGSSRFVYQSADAAVMGSGAVARPAP